MQLVTCSKLRCPAHSQALTPATTPPHPPPLRPHLLLPHPPLPPRPRPRPPHPPHQHHLLRQPRRPLHPQQPQKHRLLPRRPPRPPQRLVPRPRRLAPHRPARPPRARPPAPHPLPARLPAPMLALRPLQAPPSPPVEVRPLSSQDCVDGHWGVALGEGVIESLKMQGALSGRHRCIVAAICRTDATLMLPGPPLSKLRALKSVKSSQSHRALMPWPAGAQVTQEPAGIQQ